MEEGVFFPEQKLEGKEIFIYFMLSIRIKTFYFLLVFTLTLSKIGNHIPNFIDEETEAKEV